MAAMKGRRRRKKAAAVKRAGGRKRIFTAFLCVFLAVSTIVAVRVVLSKIVFFPVREIEVIGNRHLSADEISHLSQLRTGISILSISSKTVARKLEKSPWIKDVSLRKELPDKIIIRIKESVPSALLKKENGYFLIDEEGGILERHTATERFLPVISGQPGSEGGLREAIRLAGVLREYGVEGISESEIRYGDPEDMEFRHGPTTIRVGYGDYGEKIRRYLELKDEIARRRIPVTSIDLRYERRVVVRAAEGGTQ